MNKLSHEGPYGITVLHQPEQSSHTVFDLVGIHGLNGDSLETWTHKRSRIMWLRDLLPESLPNVRIMTYGYNAKFKNFTGEQDIRSICRKLLTELADLRRIDEEKSRPVVFVCHSLGGIIAKKALLLGCPAELVKIQQSVFGILFLGTPHQGSSIAACGKVVGKIVAACSPLNPAINLFKALQKESKVLFEISEDFKHKTTKLQLISFFEMEMTSFGGIFTKMIVDQRSAILGVPNEIIIGQYADHRDLVRFSSAHDRNFRPVLSRLQYIADDILNKDKPVTRGKVEIHSPLLGSMSPRLGSGKSRFFDIPFAPCNTFHGREELLTSMKDYFSDGKTEDTTQRIFAICGLGGSGKTQAALQFATQNRHKYDSGVWFFNADSNATLQADFTRIYEMLKLGHASNKVDAVKQWFSKAGNSDWLLIFDNADDLNSIRISRFLPASSGDVIITSRDRAVIDSVAKKGYLMETLTTNEAVTVLLHKAGIDDASPENLKLAREIVKRLGCLPLAVDQGGAYIRSRNKTLAEYQRLFEERQLEVLTFKPRLAEYDKTVLTAWEVNFKQVEIDSKEASNLLLLFCFLDFTDIFESMLSRGCSPQKRWDSKGEVSSVSATESGLDPEVVDLIGNEIRFDAAIEKLLSYSLIHIKADVNGSRQFSLHPLVQYSATQRLPMVVQDKWRQEAILLLCHAFPRNDYLEPLYGDIGRSVFPHVLCVLKEYDKLAKRYKQPASVRHGLANMLLAASRFDTLDFKFGTVRRVRELMQDDEDCNILALATDRESALLRMSGKLQQSNEALEKFIHTVAFSKNVNSSETDASWNAQRGSLVVSFAENLIQESEFTRAQNELSEWNPINPLFPSTREQMILRTKNLALGKVFRFEGHFEKALPYFTDLLRQSEIDVFFEGTVHHRILLSNIADMYCELGQPARAAEVLKVELQNISTGSTLSVNNERRLHLSMAESLLRQNYLDEAEQCLQDLRPAYDACKDKEMLTRLGIFRMWMGLARISHLRSQWDDALARWHEALHVLETATWEQPFTIGVVRYSVAYVLYRLGRFRESSKLLDEAKSDLAREGRKFWIVGLGSYWFDYVTGLPMPTGDSGGVPAVEEKLQDMNI